MALLFSLLPTRDSLGQREYCGLVFSAASRASIEKYHFNAHPSLLLKAISVANVLALVSLGKTPTTLMRRFTSLKRRSSMFVERILAW
jgi:hypothetical protein